MTSAHPGFTFIESIINSIAVPKRSFRIARSNTGLGLFAIEEIRKRAFIVQYTGRLITTEESDRREARGASYMFEVNKNWTIDGSTRRNLARYVNHACRPNAEAVGRKGGIAYVARRKIRPGEEITVDYGKDYYRCFLEEGGCRCATCVEKRRAKRRARRLARAKAQAAKAAKRKPRR